MGSPDRVRISPPQYRSPGRPFCHSNQPTPIKVDMKRGSFSYKQKITTSGSLYGDTPDRTNSRRMATEPDMRRESKARDGSPGLTARSLRFQQMSKRYQLDKSSLQQSVWQLNHRSQSSVRKATPVRERQGLWTPEPLPSVAFMAELEFITKINDFPGW